MRKPLPKTKAIPDTLPGTVQLQMVKCGKQNCRCANGKLHKAYYRFWREKGKLRKVYVRRADVERVKAACALRVEERNFILAFINTPAGDTIRKEIRQMLRSAGAQPKIINRYRSRFR